MNELVFYDLKHATRMAPSLSTQIARELGRRVVAGTYKPGSLLDDEATLAERYQVSRVVVRDAVKVLVGKGLLEARRGIGTRVRPRNHWVLLDDDVLAWHLSAVPSSDVLMQLMDIRLAFEPKAARWAAERGTQEDIAQIEIACSRMEEEKGAISDFVIADALFHRAVLRAAHNEFLQAIEGVIYSALLVSIRLTNTDPRENKKSIPFHRDVYKAVAARDSDLAERLIEELLADASKRLGGSPAKVG